MRKETLYETRDNNCPTSITISKSYLLFDFLEIYVNLDGEPLEKVSKHGYVLPVNENLFGIAAAINQYGILHTNYVQVWVTKENPTIIGLSNTNVAITHVVGVNIN